MHLKYIPLTMKFAEYFIIYFLLIIAYSLTSCTRVKEPDAVLKAESLIEMHPDSALNILRKVDRTALCSKEAQAHYGLLMTMALDKNYIDITVFDILQPAIDYYLQNGTPDEKLKTLYYQGCIFLNKGDKDNALNSFVKSLDIMNQCNDSLCIARVLVAQAGIYNDFYDFGSYLDNYLRAASIYNLKNYKDYEFDCLLNALNGAIILSNKHKADSILNVCSQITPISNIQKSILVGYQLSYALIFGSNTELKDLISNHENDLYHNPNGALNLALAYNKLGNNQKALQILDQLNDRKVKYDTLKYLPINVSILDSLGRYKEAFSTYVDFSLRLDSINALKFEEKAKSVEEKHKMELQAQNDAREKSVIIWVCTGGIVFFAMAAFILYILVRSNMVKKDLAIQKARTTELENEELKSEKKRLFLENTNLQLERDKKKLEAENLAHRVEKLESESESLNILMEKPEEIPSEVQEAIKIRIEMLNSLLASYITEHEQYEKPYDFWVKELTENTEEFMNSNRLAFQVSHPHFIQYFENHNLTTDEINYVCLYAIGLRGKEVGNYMKKRSHVNISSAIRKKLGIDRHETNIGIYVRKLLKSL